MLIGILVPVFVFLACLAAATPKLHLVCVFYELTGLYCPGCGSGRAVNAILHGEIGKAFGYNPMVFLLGIPAAAVFFHEYLRLVFPSLELKPVKVPQRLSTGILWALLLFWILRNIPMFSFLAP